METNSLTYLVSRGLECLNDDPAQALVYIKRALADHPGDAAANWGMGRIESLQGDPVLAMERYRVALGSRRWRGHARVGLGDALTRLGKTDKALAEYLQAPASLRETPEVALRIAACNMAMRQPKAAAAVLRRQYRRHPKNSYVAALLARCYTMMHRYEKAQAVLDILLREEPDHSEVLKAASMTAARMGDVERAVVHLRRLLEIEPSQVNATTYLYHLLLSSMPAAQVDAEYVRIQGEYSQGEATPRAPVVRRPSGIVRVGYVSGLFGGHLDCFLPLFRHHDRTRYEVHAFADNGEKYERVARLIPFCNSWNDYFTFLT